MSEDLSKNWTAEKIRRTFLEFFANKDHQIVASAPIVLKDDPTLMFTNAGMNQFKDSFLGNTQAAHSRVTDTQKCLRVSGKHNDLEEVGHDTYHHTMFEMLGNWSFGDYFKVEAITWAWELLTDVYQLDKERLYATIFEGDKEDDLGRDEEAYAKWKAFLPEERILNGNKKDNFWEMGAMGPCGPASEIHIDLRSDEERKAVNGASLVNQDHPQVVEIWNLVFMQYNRMANGQLQKLPAQHVDTGMGFERLCMALQQKQSNYDTDVFTPIISKIAQLADKKYGADETQDIAMRVVADHTRAVAFAIADGQLPGNSSAAYVIRRILRRAIRYGFSYLNFKEPFIYKLVEVLKTEMGSFFPELLKQYELITKVIKEEEASFLRTLEQGLTRLDQIMSEAKTKEVAGDQVFELYDTFGFPPDLTALILREKGFTYDESAYANAMEAQKNRARAASKLESDDWTILEEDEKEEFIGYDYLTADVRITRYRKVKTAKKTLYHLVLNLTPFYPEGGGQVGDTGFLESDSERIRVLDTKKEHGLILHTVEALPKSIKAVFKASVDAGKRMSTSYNHSATHLLHEALREVLGTHVEQKGSLVHPDYLRFDFSHFSKVTDEELERIEGLVNSRLRANYPLEEFRNIPIDEAKAMGAMALFGEKYGDTVRAIKFGNSVELCGGIHVEATGQIGIFKITSESAVASGIRRIEALTGDKARAYYNTALNLLDEVKSLLKNPKDVIAGIEQLKQENAKLQKSLEEAARAEAKQEKASWKQVLEEKNGMQILTVKTRLNAGLVKDILFQLKAEVENFAAIVGVDAGEKAQIAVAFDEGLAKDKDLHAGNMVRELAKLIGGGGGGQPFFATAGGKNPAGLDSALAKGKEILENT
jgi:alanyl-tRNA synthetase